MAAEDRDPESARRDATAPYGREDWQPGWCADAIQSALRQGLCAPAEAPRLLQALADDPRTASPKRLATPGGVRHARHLLGWGPKPKSDGDPTGRRAWCGIGACQPRTRRIEDPDTGADCGPCPRCHPSAPRLKPLPADVRIDLGGGANADLPAKGALTGAPTPGVPVPPPAPRPDVVRSSV